MIRASFIHTVLAVFCLASVTTSGAVQSDTYAQEYDLYQKAASADGAQQKALILEFVEKYESSQLDPNISYLYVTRLKALEEAQRWQELAKEAEEYLRFRPGDGAVAALGTRAYQSLGQPEKLVAFGSRLYQSSPSAATAYLVAKTYQSMNDTANFQKWAERTLQHAPDNQEMMVELIQMHWRQNDFAAAAKRAEKLLTVLPESSRPELKAFAYRAVGQNAFVLGDISQARKNFSKAAELEPLNDFTHLQLGYCCWRQGNIQNAIQCFARAAAINGSSAREARRELYNLLRAQYGNTNSAAGMIQQAKGELGIS